MVQTEQLEGKHMISIMAAKYYNSRQIERIFKEDDLLVQLNKYYIISAPLKLAGIGASLFNLQRFAVLTPQGKAATLLGTGFFCVLPIVSRIGGLASRSTKQEAETSE